MQQGSFSRIAFFAVVDSITKAALKRLKLKMLCCVWAQESSYLMLTLASALLVPQGHSRQIYKARIGLNSLPRNRAYSQSPFLTLKVFEPGYFKL